MTLAPEQIDWASSHVGSETAARIDGTITRYDDLGDGTVRFTVEGDRGSGTFIATAPPTAAQIAAQEAAAEAEQRAAEKSAAAARTEQEAAEEERIARLVAAELDRRSRG